MEAPERSTPSRRGLVELVVLVAVLVVLAATAVALFGDELRALFGVSRPGATAERPRG